MVFLDHIEWYYERIMDQIIRVSSTMTKLGREALAYCQCASALISGNKALFVSVDLIGEKNQVILE